MMRLKPFENDSDSGAIGELTVENGHDRVALYGTLDITRDKAGLALARELARFLEAAIAVLAADSGLPDKLPPPKAPPKVRNPFG